VDAFFSLKVSGDFQKFPKFSKNLEKFTIVLEFLGEFSAVFGAAEKWKNNSGNFYSFEFLVLNFELWNLTSSFAKAMEDR
jgi:hypothetical protein